MVKRLGYEAVHPLLAGAEVKKALIHRAHAHCSLALGSLNPNYHICLDRAHCAILTSYLYYNLNVVLALYLIIDWHHDINVVYKQTPIRMCIFSVYV